MNDVGVNKELEFLSSVIALLDGAINSVGDAADCMQSKTLQDSASDIESAIELLVTRELELERVAEVLNNIVYVDDDLYKGVELNNCEIKTNDDAVELIEGEKHIFLSENGINLDCIQKKNASEVEAP